MNTGVTMEQLLSGGGYEYWETNTLKYKNSNAKMEYTLDIGAIVE